MARKELLARIYFVNRPAAPEAASQYTFRKTPGKRVFDIVCATAALVLLSPLLLVVAALVRLESRGPVFYFSYRVGTGYKVFKFWKFRSMRPDADKLLASMKKLNQYATPPTAAPAVVAGLCATCALGGTGRCQSLLFDEKGAEVCEKQYWLDKKAQGGAAFVKIANDARITRAGHFIRNTSIDELPQLWNVLRGDMAIVGNRPLPLYEAEKLMTDQFAARFIAPAGITGLWQVMKRGKGGDMSEDERKALDNEYAQQHSLRKCLKILLRTIPALFQKENV
nr:sugar transferase [Hymenobacter terricola]